MHWKCIKIVSPYTRELGSGMAKWLKRLLMDRKVRGLNLGHVCRLGPCLTHVLKEYLAMLREISSDSILSWGWVPPVHLVLKKSEISTGSMSLHCFKRTYIHTGIRKKNTNNENVQSSQNAPRQLSLRIWARKYSHVFFFFSSVTPLLCISNTAGLGDFERTLFRNKSIPLL